jgi:hypothetical protein
MDRGKQLEKFVKHVETIRRLPLVTDGQGVGFSLNMDRTRGMSVRVNLLDENDLRSFLLTFRMFISPNAEIQLNKIYNTCFLGLKKNNDLRDRLVKARAVWKEALGNVGSLKFEEETYSGKDAALHWMNGGYFHSDLERYEQLVELLDRGWPYVQMHFENFVVNATRVIIYTGHVVEYARKNDLFKH